MGRYRYLAEDGTEGFLEVPPGHYPPEELRVPKPDCQVLSFRIQREFDNEEIERRIRLYRETDDEAQAMTIAFDLLAEVMLAVGFCGYMLRGEQPQAYYRGRLPRV